MSRGVLQNQNPYKIASGSKQMNILGGCLFTVTCAISRVIAYETSVFENRKRM